MKRFTFGTALALLLAVPAGAQFAGMDWDIDGDGLLDPTEFNSGFGEYATMGGYDADADGFLSEEEYSGGFRDYGIGYDSTFDTDANGFFDEDEYNASIFGTYDADRSGYLDESEVGLMGSDGGGPFGF